MSDSNEVRFSLKVFINEEKTKMLFAEADNDFVDVLLSFMLLPLGNIVKVFEKHYGDKAPSIGSLTTLYKSLSNLDIVNYWTNLGKHVLDRSSSNYEHCRLKVTVDHSVPTSYELGQTYLGVFTPNSASFIISDDLRVVPNVTGSVMQTLSKLGINITDMQGVEIRTETFGLKEIIELLKGLLLSRTPLTDLILDKRQTKQTKFTTVKLEPGILSHQIEKDAASNSKKMILNVMFQKSTKKLLFVQAEEDFVNFLFSILVIPIGRVEWLLGSNSGLHNIDNLYRSISDFVNEKHLKSSDKKDQLMKPEVQDWYTTQHFLPICEGRVRVSQQRRSFVERSRMYMITDDLTVTSLVLSSSLSILNEMAIPLSDVEEVELQIGLEEALSILKASLTSSCVLTDGLINPRLKKQPIHQLVRRRSPSRRRCSAANYSVTSPQFDQTNTICCGLTSKLVLPENPLFYPLKRKEKNYCKSANKMSDRKEVQFSLKVFINEEKTKVLFAEADNDFVDVLLSFLLLPLANIVKILEKHYGDKTPVIGSLTTLYKGLSHPDTINFLTNLGTHALNPLLRSYGHLGLKVNVDRTMSTFTTTSYGFEQSYDGVFTPNSASFIICDDLRIVPNVTGSVMQTLSKVGVNMTDMHGVEIRTVTFGLKEIAELLKGSLVSHTPLSELILDKRPTKQIRFTTVKSEPGILSHQIEKEEASNSTKMILNVMFQKSTKKLLFAQADNDFVNFLFNILVTPLGRVEWLLASNSGLNNIDNLYRSIADFIDEKHLKESDKKSQLMKPEVNEMYATQHFLPRRRQSQLRRNFVEGSRMYMITDDLTVTSLVLSSSLSILKEMAIPLSDVEEVELQIGLEEALSILKASLTSSCALTDGLINPKLKKQPMQEH